MPISVLLYPIPCNPVGPKNLQPLRAQPSAPPTLGRRGRGREEGCPVVHNHPLRRGKHDGGGRERTAPRVVHNHPLRRHKVDGGGGCTAPCRSAESFAPPTQGRRGRVREEGCPVVHNRPLRRHKADGGGRCTA